MLMYVLSYRGQLSHFPSCCGAGVTNLNEPPSSFLLPSHYCALGAGSIPLSAIVNKKQCETRGLFMSLVIHDWIWDVQDSQGVSASEMTYIVSAGALNSTHSLTPLHIFSRFSFLQQNLTLNCKSELQHHKMRPIDDIMQLCKFSCWVIMLTDWQVSKHLQCIAAHSICNLHWRVSIPSKRHRQTCCL